MKKLAYIAVLLFTMSIAFTSCREEKKTPDEKIEETIDNMGDDVEEASDDVKDAMEDVKDEIEEAKEDSQ